MTDQRLLSEQLDRFFGPEKEKSEARSGWDLARVLEARIVQLERQQQVFEEGHRRIVAQHLETSDAFLTEQRTALARLEQEVADRTRAWKERAVILEQAKVASEAESLAAQQRLLTLVYAVDAQTKVILEATVILDRDVHTVKGHEALESIRSSAAALLSIIDTCCGRDARRIAGEDACGTGEHGDDDSAAADQDDGTETDLGCPFDRDVALAGAGGDKALLKELATLFLTDGPKHLSEAKAALGRGDGTALNRAAHTLKGAAGCFGAKAVMQAASKLEKLRRAGDLGQAELMCADLEAALTSLLHALTGFVEEFGGAERD
ncbi:Hpt domain-containing protein [Candidatus Methylomirabilis sp.]|uniref:Hpt domain-containing protein n=1 Tax=Candidatus Methylomirabilis sp. TaxID=2032687 RepID=UPI003C77AC67